MTGLLSTAQLRVEYGADCTEREAAGAQEAWDAHQEWMRFYIYKLRDVDTGSRACRAITGDHHTPPWKSLHAAFLKIMIKLWNLGKAIKGGVACDFNWNTNPYGGRLVTDMPREMVDAICGLRTNSGKQVFRWGGYYTGNKDAMHYELVCSKADLATGIDPSTRANFNKPEPPQEEPLKLDQEDQDWIKKTIAEELAKADGDLSSYGDDDQPFNLNNYRVTSKGVIIQIVNGSDVNVLGHGAVPDTITEPRYSTTGKGINTRVDFDVEMSTGEIRWYTYDPSRKGFPAQGDLSKSAKLVGKDGWHYVEITIPT